MSRKQPLSFPSKPRGFWPAPNTKKGYTVLKVSGIVVYYKNGYPISRVLIPLDILEQLDAKAKELK